ncbi:unnamed protein product [Amoebophrya sp. A120]|nr:unnamed protein product [Amoebophrya sp. A120]|eukprot:GSA120T00002508001.1
MLSAPGGPPTSTSASSSSSRIVDEEVLERRIKELDRRETVARNALNQKWERNQPALERIATTELAFCRDVLARGNGGASELLLAQIQQAETANQACVRLRERVALQKHARETLSKLTRLEHLVSTRQTEKATDYGFLVFLMESLQAVSSGALVPSSCRKLALPSRIAAKIEQCAVAELAHMERWFSSLLLTSNSELRVRYVDGDDETNPAGGAHSVCMRRFWASLDRFPDLLERRVESISRRIISFLRHNFPASNKSTSHSVSTRTEQHIDPETGAQMRYCVWQVAEARPGDAGVEGTKPVEFLDAGGALVACLLFLHRKLSLSPDIGGNRIWSATAQGLMGSAASPRRSLDLRRGRSKDEDVDHDRMFEADDGFSLQEDTTSSFSSATVETLETRTRDAGLHSLAVVGDLLLRHQHEQTQQRIGTLLEQGRRLLFAASPQSSKLQPLGATNSDRADGNKDEQETAEFWRLLRAVLEAGGPLNEEATTASGSESLAAAEDLVSLFLLVRSTQRGDLSRDTPACLSFFHSCNVLSEYLTTFGMRRTSAAAATTLLRLALQLRQSAEDRLRERILVVRGSMASRLALVESADNVNAVSTAMGEAIQFVKDLLTAMDQINKYLDTHSVRRFLAEEYVKEFSTYFNRFKKSTRDEKILEALLHLQSLGIVEADLLQFQTFFTEQARLIGN